ncbi:MAG TPA: hypothetical protein VE990_12230 [Acidimicrobiales bacterium]|nr:hypothetical protein [Acidimicrobiales bacterium]
MSYQGVMTVGSAWSELERSLNGVIRTVVEEVSQVVTTALSVWEDAEGPLGEMVASVMSGGGAGAGPVTIAVDSGAGYRRGYGAGLDLAEAVPLADLIAAGAAGWPLEAAEPPESVALALTGLVGPDWATRLSADRGLAIGLASAIRDCLDVAHLG